MVNDIQNAFSALADPTRLRVLESLRERELCAGELAERCSMSGPAMSRHLRVLRKSGLIAVAAAADPDQDARLRVYQLQPGPFRSVKNWVDYMQAFWTDQLTAFKAYAENEPTSKRKGPRK